MKQKLRQALSRRQKRSIVSPGRVPSAVIVPIYDKQGVCHILFTKRAQTVKEHKGQISFPGGVYQEGDGTLLATALRECAEEIGVLPDEVEVIGELDDTITTTSSYIITPFVGFIPWPYQFRVNSGEIEKIIEIEVGTLLDRVSVSKETEIIGGKPVESYSYYYQGEVIWGATARILNQFLDIIARVKV